MLPGGTGWFMPCQVGRHYSRLRHLGWEQCPHGLTSRPLESCHHQCRRAVCGSLGYPAGAASELLDGSLKLRFCSTPFSNRFPPWSVPGDGVVGSRGYLHQRVGDAAADQGEEGSISFQSVQPTTPVTCLIQAGSRASNAKAMDWNLHPEAQGPARSVRAKRLVQWHRPIFDLLHLCVCMSRHACVTFCPHHNHNHNHNHNVGLGEFLKYVDSGQGEEDHLQSTDVRSPAGGSWDCRSQPSRTSGMPLLVNVSTWRSNRTQSKREPDGVNGPILRSREAQKKPTPFSKTPIHGVQDASLVANTSVLAAEKKKLQQLWISRESSLATEPRWLRERVYLHLPLTPSVVPHASSPRTPQHPLMVSR